MGETTRRDRTWFRHLRFVCGLPGSTATDRCILSGRSASATRIASLPSLQRYCLAAGADVPLCSWRAREAYGRVCAVSSHTTNAEFAETLLTKRRQEITRRDQQSL